MKKKNFSAPIRTLEGHAAIIGGDGRGLIISLSPYEV